MGGKYKSTYDANPAPGQYDPEGAVGVTKPKSSAAIIREETGYQVPREVAPDGGQYDYSNMYAFGTQTKGVLMGERLKVPVDYTPGPG